MSEWEEFAAYRNMIREAKAEAWEEGWAKGAGSPDDLSAPNPYVKGKDQ